MGAPAALLIVSGLKREATIFTGPGVTTICGDPPTLHAKLARLAVRPRMVISAGICGALDPSLCQGNLVLGTEVVAGGERIETDAILVQALARNLKLSGKTVVLGAIAAADTPVHTAQAKAKLRAGTGAIAVDMESLIAGRFATKHAVPFVILRAVSDAANRDLPPLVLEALSPDGRIDIAAVLAGLIRRPGQLPLLVAAARDSALAFRALRSCRGLPGFFRGLDSMHF
ncbi:MAG: phosphorylase [Hyphomicrobiales bacterium]|nr:phosphorylase [Hyphomicrobiales bacterium]